MVGTCVQTVDLVWLGVGKALVEVWSRVFGAA